MNDTEEKATQRFMSGGFGRLGSKITHKRYAAYIEWLRNKTAIKEEGMSLEDLTRALTTEVGDLHVQFNDGKITWAELDGRANYYEKRYIKKIQALITNHS